MYLDVFVLKWISLYQITIWLLAGLTT